MSIQNTIDSDERREVKGMSAIRWQILYLFRLYSSECPFGLCLVGRETMRVCNIGMSLDVPPCPCLL